MGHVSIAADANMAAPRSVGWRRGRNG